MFDWQVGISIYLADDWATSLGSDTVRPFTPIRCDTIKFYARQVMVGTLRRSAGD